MQNNDTHNTLSKKNHKETLELYFNDLLIEEPLIQTDKTPKKPFPSSQVNPQSQLKHKPVDDQGVNTEPAFDEREKLKQLLLDTEGQQIIKEESIPVFNAEGAIERKNKEIKNKASVEDATKDSVENDDGSDSLVDVNFELRPKVAAELDALAAEANKNAIKVLGCEWLDNGYPEWAQNDFDVLLLQVSGLTLAVPLVALGKIYRINEELTPIFGQVEWFMGLLSTSLGKVKTVNTSLFVMPERYDKKFLETAKFVVSINGLPWGLAVDSVNQPIVLKQEDVNWRSKRSKRQWLAGTVKEHMCALIDIPMLGKLFEEADENALGNE